MMQMKQLVVASVLINLLQMVEEILNVMPPMRLDALMIWKREEEVELVVLALNLVQVRVVHYLS